LRFLQLLKYIIQVYHTLTSELFTCCDGLRVGFIVGIMTLYLA